MTKLRQLESLLFREGWVFLIPYLLVYVACYGAGVPTSGAKLLFVILHFINLVLFVDFVIHHRREVRRADLLFWAVALLFVLLPGAYLEYPSDPWEHFRRIFAWQQSPDISHNEFPKRMSYFWGWTTMFWVEPVHRRLALDLYSAFWQVMVLIQFRALLRRLGISGPWLALHSFGFFALFGHNLFGIRYYALSSTLPAYLAYFRFVAIVLDGLQGARRRYVSELLLLLFIYFNHFQEAGFALLSSMVLIASNAFSALGPSRKRLAVACASALVALGLAWGFWMQKYMPSEYTKYPPGQLSILGTYRVWARSGVFVETLGFHGILSMILGLTLMRSRELRTQAALGIAPLAALFFPPAVFFISRETTAAMDAYRLLYAFPTSIVLISGLNHLLSRFSEKSRIAVVSAIVLVLALPMNYPWRGRLAFQLTRTSPERAMEPLSETAQWLSQNRKFAPDCTLLSDNATLFVVSSHLGLRSEFDYTRDHVRVSTVDYGRHRLNQDQLSDIFKHFRVCGILIAYAGRIPPPGRREIGSRSGHWPTDLGDLTWQTTREFEESGALLSQAGWTKTEIPPFYAWYDPPSTPTMPR